MWCKHCRQDVPSIGSPNQAGMSCARCSAAMSAEGEPTGASVSATAEPAERLDLDVPKAPLTPYPSFEDWEVEQSLRNLQARVGRGKRADQAAPSRLQAAERADRNEARQMHATHKSAPRPHLSQPRAPGRIPLLARSVVLLGLAIFACGAGLLGWSIAEQRVDLWNLGVPATIAAQAVLVLGLVLQLERVWQNSRYTVRKLDQVESQLASIQHAAKMLTMTHTSAAQAFYAHMADDAEPQLLLADLKGQLDLLAMSISKRSA
jgi:hypothetical protein